MSLHQTIKDGIKDAMKAKDAVRLSVMRGLTSAFTNELVNLKRTPQDALSDDEALAVVKRAIKQRKDSIEQFTAGGRPELAESEQAELAILQTFVPATMSKEAIKEVAEKIIAEKGFDKSKMGIAVGAIMKELKGAAEGSDVKEVVEGLLA